MSQIRALPLMSDPGSIFGLVVGASRGVLSSSSRPAPAHVERSDTAASAELFEALPVSNTGGKVATGAGCDGVGELAGAVPVEIPEWDGKMDVIDSPESARIDTLTFSFSGLRFGCGVHSVRVWLSKWSGGKLTIGGNIATRYNGYRQCLQVVLGSGGECPSLGWLGISDISDPMRGRWCLHLSGAACNNLTLKDWERLHSDLADYEGRITRIDLAVDELDGAHSIDWVRSQYEAGNFNLSGRPPKFQFIQSSDGNTFYVGKRGSGKICRSYQKGRQQGDENSSWVRHEVEIRNVSRFIPLDIFLSPTKYFKGAYPSVFSWLAGGSSLIATFRAKHKIIFDLAIKYAKRQVGRLVRYCSEVIGYSPEQIIDDLQADSGLYPVRLFVIDDEDIDLAFSSSGSLECDF